MKKILCLAGLLIIGSFLSKAGYAASQSPAFNVHNVNITAAAWNGLTELTTDSMTVINDATVSGDLFITGSVTAANLTTSSAAWSTQINAANVAIAASVTSSASVNATLVTYGTKIGDFTTSSASANATLVTYGTKLTDLATSSSTQNTRLNNVETSSISVNATLATNSTKLTDFATSSTSVNATLATNSTKLTDFATSSASVNATLVSYGTSKANLAGATFTGAVVQSSMSCNSDSFAINKSSAIAATVSPASAFGEIRIGADATTGAWYIYVSTAANVWGRAALSGF